MNNTQDKTKILPSVSFTGDTDAGHIMFTQEIQELKDVLDEKVLLGFCYEIERANFTQERYEEFLQTLSDFISQKLKEQASKIREEVKSLEEECWGWSGEATIKEVSSILSRY